MKLIHTADLHIGMENYGRLNPETGLSTRLGDFLRSFDQVVDFAVENKADAFLFAGDAYKTREPTPTYQREFAKRILKLSRNNVPVVLLVGNHDTPNALGKANTLDIYSTLELPNIYVIRKPEVITVPTKTGPLQVIGLPWIQKKEFETIAETIQSLYEKADPEVVTVAMVHASVEDSVFGSERIVSLGGDYVVPKALLMKPKLSYVALGHIHKRQVVHQDPPMVYPGSIERVDFGEENEEKSFELVEIEGAGAKHQPIKVKAREFLTINLNVTNPSVNLTEEILSEIAKNDLKDKVVKLVLNLPSEGNEIEMDKVKKALSEAFIIAGISRNVSKTARNPLIQGAVIEGLSPIQLLEKYFEGKKYSPNKIELLKKVAQELMAEE
ncbi:MAG: exonuclease SbcCD subunit D [Patescibacteria group bacterium]|nr:exonuclease SbcCD subunit D [Patescibacteria group bacterium]